MLEIWKCGKILLMRKAGYVLAARQRLRGDVVVEMPPKSRMEHEPILTEEAKFTRYA